MICHQCIIPITTEIHYHLLSGFTMFYLSIHWLSLHDLCTSKSKKRTRTIHSRYPVIHHDIPGWTYKKMRVLTQQVSLIFPRALTGFSRFFFWYVSPRDPQPWVEHFLKLTDDPWASPTMGSQRFGTRDHTGWIEGWFFRVVEIVELLI